MPGPFDPKFDELPHSLPIFPLPGALLLPRGDLPLNIFEPRYVAMISDTLKTDSRMIGMIQPVDVDAEPSVKNLCRVGCAGRITTFSETEDGRFVLSLTGLIRFTVSEELGLANGYRRVVPIFDEFQGDLVTSDDLEQIDREALMAATRAYFDANGYDTDWKAMEKTSVLSLVTSLAMACPFDDMEKQALLEAPTPFERANVLTSLLEMGAAAGANDAVTESSMN